MVHAPSEGWTIVVPVKGLSAAKSRLDTPLRSELALAFALDVVAVSLECVATVLVVTSDDAVAAAVSALGAQVVAEAPAAADLMNAAELLNAADPLIAADPLNAAVRTGVLAARTLTPQASIAVLTSDLPSLTVAALAAALDLAARHPLALVTDAAATGTTMITGRPGQLLDPRFGRGSRHRHEAGGHVLLDVADGSPLRHDVDSAADLDIARALGVGPHTRAALERLDRLGWLGCGRQSGAGT